LIPFEKDIVNLDFASVDNIFLQVTTYSYLMGVQAIDQNIFAKVLGKTKVFYCPRSTTEGDRTLWSFPIPREILFDLLPALPLNNCLVPNYNFFQTD
jgi:hypothetical protein